MWENVSFHARKSNLGPEQAGGRREHGVEEAGEIGAGSFREPVEVGQGKPGEASQVAVRLAVEEQRPGQRVDDRLARGDRATLLQPRVPGDANAGEQGDFLPTQPRRVASPWWRVEPDVVWLQAGPAGLQVRSQLETPGGAEFSTCSHNLGHTQWVVHLLLGVIVPGLSIAQRPSCSVPSIL